MRQDVNKCSLVFSIKFHTCRGDEYTSIKSHKDNLGNTCTNIKKKKGGGGGVDRNIFIFWGEKLALKGDDISSYNFYNLASTCIFLSFFQFNIIWIEYPAFIIAYFALISTFLRSMALLLGLFYFSSQND